MLRDISIAPLSGRAPRQAVLYLHGATRRASDVVKIAAALRPALPEALFLAPEAPLACNAEREVLLPSSKTVPFGYLWYPVDDFSPPVLYPRIKENAVFLDAYLDHVMRSYPFRPEEIALVGMSQGTMIGLYVALRRAAPLAGILGFSGALPDTESLAHEGRCAPPVFLVHGTEDDQVPFWRMEEARQALSTFGVEVETLARPHVGHAIDPAGLAQGALFLRRVFGLETARESVQPQAFALGPASAYSSCGLTAKGRAGRSNFSESRS